MKSFLTHLKYVLCGLVFGIANVIPGVSGGTMLVVFGIYDKLTESISGIKKIITNIWFLVSFGIGAGCGIIFFSYVITGLFDNYGVQTNMFFIGLILGSIPLIIKNGTKTEKVKPLCIIPFILALALVVGMTVLQDTVNTDPYTLSQETSNGITTVTLTNNNGQTINDWYISIENAEDGMPAISCDGATISHKAGTLEKIKSIFGMKSPEIADTFYPLDEQKTIEANGSVSFTFTSASDIQLELKPVLTYSMNVMLFLMLLGGGAIAAVAMIIPGVSGSFVMMLLGLYTTVIGAVKSLDFVILIPAAIGILIGVIFGARLISWLLKKYSLIVYSTIMGLVIGSVYAILPDGFGMNTETYIGFATLLVGGVIALLMGKYSKEE